MGSPQEGQLISLPAPRAVNGQLLFALGAIKDYIHNVGLSFLISAAGYAACGEGQPKSQPKFSRSDVSHPDRPAYS